MRNSLSSSSLGLNSQKPSANITRFIRDNDKTGFVIRNSLSSSSLGLNSQKAQREYNAARRRDKYKYE